MWREWLKWFMRLFAFQDRPGITPHPPLDSDQGEREQIESRMELDSMHAGFRR